MRLFFLELECHINIIWDLKDTVIDCEWGFFVCNILIGKKFFSVHNTCSYTKYPCQTLKMGVDYKICGGEEITLPLFNMVVST